jgi:hypothetical protein
LSENRNMNRKSFSPFGLMAVTTLLIAFVQPSVLRAQALLNIRVGDTPSKLSKFGPVSGEDKYKGMDLFKWILPNRNVLTATVDREGEIVYLESDWGGKSDDTGCDLAGFKFGVTTLADLEARFGSNGFGFKTRPHTRPVDDGVILLNSYEVGNVVVTFYTRISGADYAKVQAARASATGTATGAEFARLEGISMANAAYATSEWGARVANTAYKKVDWK